MVGTVTRSRAGRSGIRIPAGAGDSFLLQIVQTCCGSHPVSFWLVTGVKWLGRDVDRSLPSNMSRAVAAVPVCLRVMDGDNFIFFTVVV